MANAKGAAAANMSDIDTEFDMYESGEPIMPPSRSFWGQKLDSKNKSVFFESDSEFGVSRQLRLAQVALGPDAQGGPVSLQVTVEAPEGQLDEDEDGNVKQESMSEPPKITCVLCTLTPGKVLSNSMLESRIPNCTCNDVPIIC